MFLLSVAMALGLATHGIADVPTPDNHLMKQLDAKYSVSMHKLLAASPKKACNKHNVRVRKEWNSLSSAERIAYTDAVRCLQQKPALYSTDYIPGVRTHFDDFVGTHMTQVPQRHNTGSFLAWHRLLVNEYERRLRDLCGYMGSQPYWHWPTYADDPAKNPMFSGAEDSMSDSGVYSGDCIHNGPFANMTVNLGPTIGVGRVGNWSGYDYNPRCLKRFVNPYFSSILTTLLNVTDVLTLWPDYYSFDAALENPSVWLPDGSVHAGGHFTFGSEPMVDVSSSPADPIFYLHHAQVDRMWAMWQSQDLNSRLYQIQGPRMPLSDTPSVNVTLDDPIDLGVLHGDIPIREVMSTVDGVLCYIYE